MPRTDDLHGGRAHIMQECDLDPLDLDLDAYQVAFCNAYMRDSHKPSTSSGKREMYHLARCHPVRTLGDHHAVGRSSAGIVLASKKYMATHPHEVWLNLYVVYGLVAGWGNDAAESSTLLWQRPYTLMISA
eukprot:5831169-Amphidinium_carterae.2